MKLPRWLSVSLIAATSLSILGLGSWWWYTWPTRTIQEFTTLIEQGRFDEANRMLMPPGRWVIETSDSGQQLRFEDGQVVKSKLFSSTVWRDWCARQNLQTEPRSVGDFIRSRQPFSFHAQFTPPFFIGGLAERGTIILH